MYSSPFLATYGWNEDEPLFMLLAGTALAAGLAAGAAGLATALVAGFAVAVAALAVVLGAGMEALVVAFAAGFAVLVVAMRFLKDGQKWIFENPQS
jgi:membrane protein implicated in regulation of membrane protease activity